MPVSLCNKVSTVYLVITHMRLRFPLMRWAHYHFNIRFIFYSVFLSETLAYLYIYFKHYCVTGQLQKQTPNKDPWGSEPQTPALWEMGSLGHLVQIPAFGPYTVNNILLLLHLSAYLIVSCKALLRWSSNTDTHEVV